MKRILMRFGWMAAVGSLAGTLVGVAPASGQVPADAVILYEEYDRGGRFISVRPGQEEADLRQREVCTLSLGGIQLCLPGETWNDRISSVYIPPGFMLAMWDDVGFGGARLLLNSGIHNLNQFTIADTRTWNDAVSSVETTSDPVEVGDPDGRPLGRLPAQGLPPAQVPVATTTAAPSTAGSTSRLAVTGDHVPTLEWGLLLIACGGVLRFARSPRRR